MRTRPPAAAEPAAPVPDVGWPRAYVRLVEPAVEDLARLVRRDPQIARQVLKKMLLLERDPRAGEPLLGALIGFRKLTVGDRHWRIVWRLRTDAGREVVEIAEVWAAGSRTDGEVYAEMSDRVQQLPDTPRTQALAEVIRALGRAAGTVTATHEPTAEAVPHWLVERLVKRAGMAQPRVEQMSPEDAMAAWEAFLTRPHD
jgi:mRNA interferase RelE/StbE